MWQKPLLLTSTEKGQAKILQHKALVYLLLIFFLSSAAIAETKKDLSSQQHEDSRDAWVPSDKIGELYLAQCSVCHGNNLEGKAIGPPLVNNVLLHGESLDRLIKNISDGFINSGMPAWKKSLTQNQIKALAVYILEKRTTKGLDAILGVGTRPQIPNTIQTTEQHKFTLKKIHDGLTHPYAIAPLNNGNILVSEKTIGLSLLSDDGKTKTLIKNTPKVFNDCIVRGSTYTGNGWLHDVEIHPQYKDNGWIYLSHGHRCEKCNTLSQQTNEPVVMVQLVRGRIVGDQWVDQEIIWRAKPETYINGAEVGMGARIAFDNAGYVYLTLGNMLANYAGAQDLDKPYGKILRLHDDGRIPSDNPFFDNKKALPSIWTLGHRNPQGISFDKKQNVLWQSEHGPRGGDEANVLLPGRNYGWPLVSLGLDYDGAPIHYGEQLGIKFDPKNLTPTKIDWTPSLGVSSIAFYQLKDSDGFDNINEASTYFSKWQNDLLVATLASNDLLRVTTDKDEIINTEIIVKDIGRIRDVEPGWKGEIYLLLEHSTGSTIIIMQQADQPKKAS